MKTVYICGDSFAVADPEYKSDYWVSRLRQQLLPDIKIVNLSKICASNLQISLQVDAALSSGADYIIYLATSSARDDVQFRNKDCQPLTLDRYVDLTSIDSQSDLTSVSLSYLKNSTIFTKAQHSFIQQWLVQYQPLELAIYKNRLFIEATLAKLQQSNIPFVFDSGGFEHDKFTGAKTHYFDQYQAYFSQYNLWDFVDPGMSLRPYYHITDSSVHAKIADYYCEKIRASV